MYGDFIWLIINSGSRACPPLKVSILEHFVYHIWSANFDDSMQEASVEVRLDTRTIPKKDSFKYLGSIIQESGNIDDDIIHRIDVAWMK